MNRRLRKKYRHGEYQELGFEVHTRLKDGLAEQVIDDFVDAFLVEAERFDLGCYMYWNTKHFCGTITNCARRGKSKRLRLSTTLEHRDALQSWLENNSKEVVAEFEVGDFVDLWRGMKTREWCCKQTTCRD